MDFPCSSNEKRTPLNVNRKGWKFGANISGYASQSTSSQNEIIALAVKEGRNNYVTFPFAWNMGSTKRPRFNEGNEKLRNNVPQKFAASSKSGTEIFMVPTMFLF